MRVKEVIKELVEALKSAQAHLKYCGYGDVWERECAESDGLEPNIEKALENGKEWLDKKSNTVDEPYQV